MGQYITDKVASEKDLFTQQYVNLSVNIFF